MKYSYKFSLSKLNADGTAPIRCRISFDSKRVDIRLGFSVNADEWNPETQTVKPKSKKTRTNAVIINNALSQMTLKIEQLFTKSILFSKNE